MMLQWASTILLLPLSVDIEFLSTMIRKESLEIEPELLSDYSKEIAKDCYLPPRIVDTWSNLDLAKLPRDLPLPSCHFKTYEVVVIISFLAFLWWCLALIGTWLEGMCLVTMSLKTWIQIETSRTWQGTTWKSAPPEHKMLLAPSQMDRSLHAQSVVWLPFLCFHNIAILFRH